MYYVIYVGSGNETRAELLIRQMVSKTHFYDCFHPVRNVVKKIHGAERQIYERLLPGYVFIESEDIRSFYQELRLVPIFLNLLGKEELEEETDFYPLTEAETLWLKKLIASSSGSGESDRVIGLSQVGFDENDQVQVISGPLLGLQGKIKKINLHKRIAEVEVEFMNTLTVLYLGIEIMENFAGEKKDNHGL